MDVDEKLELDNDGRIAVRYRAWEELPEDLFSDEPSRRLVSLDCSFNSLVLIPEAVGETLQRLIELDCSQNQIRSLPKSLGLLKQLQTIKANGNQLRSIPEEISGCRSLSRLEISENNLVDIPETLAECKNLQVLLLQSNNLRLLPPVLAQLSVCVREFDVSDNDALQMIPKELRGNCSMVLWVLSLHFDRLNEIDRLAVSAREAAERLEASERLNDDLKEEIRILRMEKSELLNERQSVEQYLRAKKFMAEVKQKAEAAMAILKRMFEKRATAVGPYG